MKQILFLLIGFVCGISICATSIDKWPSIEEERIAKERDYYIQKSEVSQMVIWQLATFGEKYPEFVNDVLDVYAETDLAEAAYDMEITIWPDDVDQKNMYEYFLDDVSQVEP